MTPVAATSRRWASATFSGARHELAFTAADDAALAAWLGAVPEALFGLRGHLVADVVVTAVSRAEGVARISVEALTLEEC